MECVTDALVELGEGEAIELVDRPETETEYMELARRKTGALFRAAAELGAIAAGADGRTIEALGEYAERVGVAFQIRDDVLDATAASEDLGKPAGTDEAMDRPSIVRVTDRSPAELNALAEAESERAMEAPRQPRPAGGRGLRLPGISRGVRRFPGGLRRLRPPPGCRATTRRRRTSASTARSPASPPSAPRRAP